VPVWVGPQAQVAQVGTPLQQLVQSLLAAPATIPSFSSRFLSVSFANSSFLIFFRIPASFEEVSIVLRGLRPAPLPSPEAGGLSTALVKRT
jgi:hypothetical protein